MPVAGCPGRLVQDRLSARSRLRAPATQIDARRVVSPEPREWITCQETDIVRTCIDVGVAFYRAHRGQCDRGERHLTVAIR